MKTSKKLATLAVGGTLAVGLAACGSSAGTSSNGSSNASSPSSTARAQPSPVADITNLTGVHTQVMLDSGFVSALGTLKLTPGTVGTATLQNGTLTFPITGGNVKYYKPGTVNPYVQGKIEHNGSGISLTSGSLKVELTDFVIDPGMSMLYGNVSANGKQVVANAPLFFLDGSTLQPLMVDKSSGTGVLQGTKVEVSSAAAMLLDKTFNTTAVTPNFLVGIAKITVKLPS